MTGGAELLLHAEIKGKGMYVRWRLFLLLLLPTLQAAHP